MISFLRFRSWKVECNSLIAESQQHTLQLHVGVSEALILQCVLRGIYKTLCASTFNLHSIPNNDVIDVSVHFLTNLDKDLPMACPSKS